MNNALTMIASTFFVGFVGYRTLSKYTDIQFDKIDNEIEVEDELVKSLYEEQLNKAAKDLVDDIINQVCIELVNESNTSSISYDVCSCCSSNFSYTDVNVE